MARSASFREFTKALKDFNETEFAYKNSTAENLTTKEEFEEAETLLEQKLITWIRFRLIEILGDG